MDAQYTALDRFHVVRLRLRPLFPFVYRLPRRCLLPFRLRFPLGLLVPLLLLFTHGVAWADYTTPGTGVDWTMDDLVANSGGAVTGGSGLYEVHQSVTVSVGDRLTVAAGAQLTFLDTSGTVRLEIHGGLRAVGTASAPIRFGAATPTPGAWLGLVYRDVQAGSEFHLAHCEIAHANTAIDVVGADVLVEHCDLHDNLDKVLDFSSAGGEVRNCRLHDNRRRTVVMTLSSSPVIEYCTMENNNIDNTSPYPYINIGLQGTNSPIIRGCTILGSGHHMSGGISLWNASNGLIERNRIEGCGYGILCYQTGASPMIRGNLILSNNIHPDTLNWGFGIACNGNNAPIVTQNVIRGHGYGVAAVNGGRPNLGNLGNASADDDGGNHITENGLSRVYGFYNNTPLAQTAQGNWWGGATQQEVEDAIFHQADNPSLGPVDYSQWLMVDAVEEPPVGEPPMTDGIGVRAHPLLMRVCPNPFVSDVRVEWILPRGGFVSAMVFDAAGRVRRQLFSGRLPAGLQSLSWDGTDYAGRPLPSGTYFCRVLTSEGACAGRLSILRGR